jgi:hypothetical protein
MEPVVVTGEPVGPAEAVVVGEEFVLAGFPARRERISALAYGTDLRTAALQFAAAPWVVSAVIPGARSARQVTENIAPMKARIPAEFWAELKSEKLIARRRPLKRTYGVRRSAPPLVPRQAFSSKRREPSHSKIKSHRSREFGPS